MDDLNRIQTIKLLAMNAEYIYAIQNYKPPSQITGHHSLLVSQIMFLESKLFNLKNILKGEAS